MYEKRRLEEPALKKSPEELQREKGCEEWLALLRREIAMENDGEHRRMPISHGPHGYSGPVIYSRSRFYFDPTNADSLDRNATLVCACFDSIRRYYRVLPPAHCLPDAFRDCQNARIRRYLTAWEDEDERKVVASVRRDARRESRKRQARGL